ncbi:hypothetical protein TNCV_3101211 [Trichonephila clavipes]|nr:hypothetical protein TNCV_3101211 [Trichonephila clavipes]
MRSDQKTKQKAVSSKPKVSVILRRAKNMITPYICKCSAQPKHQERLKSIGNPGQCESLSKAPEESHCPLSPNHWTWHPWSISPLSWSDCYALRP